MSIFILDVWGEQLACLKHLIAIILLILKGNFIMEVNRKEIEQQFFDKIKKSGAEEKLKEIYDNIANEIINDSSIITQIPLKESQIISKYIDDLKTDLKEVSVEIIKDSKLSEDVAIIICSKVMRKVDNPKIKTFGIIEIPFDNKIENETYEPETNEKLQKYQTLKNVSSGVAFASGVTTAVLCLTVPGWNGVSAAAKIVGMFLCAGSTVTAVATHKKREDILKNQIKPEDLLDHDEFKDTVTKYCTYQFESNKKVIEEWINCIFNELFDELQDEIKYYE